MPTSVRLAYCSTYTTCSCAQRGQVGIRNIMTITVGGGRGQKNVHMFHNQN